MASICDIGMDKAIQPEILFVRVQHSIWERLWKQRWIVLRKNGPVFWLKGLDIDQSKAPLGTISIKVDMILTPKGEEIFLELSPTGQFRWTEPKTRLPMANLLHYPEELCV